MSAPYHSIAGNFRSLSTLIIAFLLTTIITPSSQGELLVYEGFGVGDGGYEDNASIDGHGHGSGWTEGEWEVSGKQSDFFTMDGSLVSPGAASQEGILIRTAGAGVNDSLNLGRRYEAGLGGPLPPVSEAWVSFYFQRNADARELVINPFSNSTDGGAGQYFGLKAANASDELFLTCRTGNAQTLETSETSFPITLGVDYFVVGQLLLYESGIEDEFKVWIFEVGNYPSSLPETPTMSISGDLDATFDSWAIISQNPRGFPNVLIFDEFKIGASLEDVLPKPAG